MPYRVTDKRRHDSFAFARVRKAWENCVYFLFYFIFRRKKWLEIATLGVFFFLFGFDINFFVGHKDCWPLLLVALNYRSITKLLCLFRAIIWWLSRRKRSEIALCNTTQLNEETLDIEKKKVTIALSRIFPFFSLFHRWTYNNNIICCMRDIIIIFFLSAWPSLPIVFLLLYIFLKFIINNFLASHQLTRFFLYTYTYY